MDQFEGGLEGGLVEGAGRYAYALHPEFGGNCFALSRIVSGTADHRQVDPGLGKSPGQGGSDHTEPAGNNAVTTFQVIK